MDLLEMLKHRRSVRDYTGEAIPKEQLDSDSGGRPFISVRAQQKAVGACCGPGQRYAERTG